MVILRLRICRPGMTRALLVVASGLYRLLARRMRGYADAFD
jgi:hypothetical protein